MSHWESVNLFQHLTIVRLTTAASINNTLRSRPRCGGCHFRTFKSGGDLLVRPFQTVLGGNKGTFPSTWPPRFPPSTGSFGNDFKICPLDLWDLQMEPRRSLTGHSERHKGDLGFAIRALNCWALCWTQTHCIPSSFLNRFSVSRAASRLGAGCCCLHRDAASWLAC